VQLAAPVVGFTLIAPHVGMEVVVPATVTPKLNFPDGAVGVNAIPVPASCAVRVTGELTVPAPGLETLIVAANGMKVWVAVPAAAVVKFVSPE
jgi:hypothetical protein